MFTEFLFNNKFYKNLTLHLKLYMPIYIVLSLPDSINIILYGIDFFFTDAVINIVTVRIPNALELLEDENLYEWVVGAFFFNLLLAWVLNSAILLLVKKESIFQKIVIVLGFIFFIHILIYLVIFLYFFSMFIFNCKLYLIVAWLFSSTIWLAIFLNPVHITYNQIYQTTRNVYLQVYVSFLISCFILGLLCIFFMGSDIIIFFKPLFLCLIKYSLVIYKSIKLHPVYDVLLLLFICLVIVWYIISKKRQEPFIDAFTAYLLIQTTVLLLIILFFLFA